MKKDANCPESDSRVISIISDNSRPGWNQTGNDIFRRNALKARRKLSQKVRKLDAYLPIFFEYKIKIILVL